MSELETKYYLRLNVDDRPGVFAQIAKLLGDLDISYSLCHPEGGLTRRPSAPR